MLDNTKAQKETLVKLKRNTFCQSLKQETNNNQGKVLETTPEVPSVNIFEHNNKDSRKNTSQAASKSNGKALKENGNSLLQYFGQTSPTRNIRTRSSFSKGNVPREIKTKCSSRWKYSLFHPILRKAYEGSGSFRNIEGVQNSLFKIPVQEKIPLNTPLKEK